MTTETEKKLLLEDFKEYLQQSHVEPVENNGQPDLHTLLSEITALKTEVKAESRQFKNTLDTLSSAQSILENSNQTLTEELVKNALQLEKQHAEIIRTMLLHFIDIYDRLTLGRDVLQNYRPIESLFKSSRKKDIHFIKGFKQGHDMTIKRIGELLQQYQVYSINCVGELFDPVTMQAVETGCFPELENGRVVDELRKGFLIQDQVLRLAEVKVNKLTPGKQK